MGFVLEADYPPGAGATVMRDRGEIDLFIDGLLTSRCWPFAVRAYAVDESSNQDVDHELVLAVAPQRGRFSLCYVGPETGGVWYSIGQHHDGHIVDYDYLGGLLTFPPAAEVSAQVARAALYDLLVSKGRRPDCVSWHRDNGMRSESFAGVLKSDGLQRFAITQRDRPS